MTHSGNLRRNDYSEGPGKIRWRRFAVLFAPAAAVTAIMVTLTVLSGARYLWKIWSLIAGT